MRASRGHAHFDVRHGELACGWRLVHLVERRGHGDGEDEAHETRREKSGDIVDARVDGVHGGGEQTTGGGETTTRTRWGTVATFPFPFWRRNACRALPRARC